ncbi:MAG: DUF4157 domain-containing protein, partial [Deltaproteobacteria bacterium]|nr:DUF4157 domain-containing protein [Deltaproteobacteria bacterium]
MPNGRLAVIGMGQPLESRFREQAEGFFGVDFSGVRIHEGLTAQGMGALALTRGDTLHLARRLYDTSTREGVELLGHELMHVVQQREGRVANPYGQGIAIVQDPSLEAEARTMGQQLAEEIWARSSPRRFRPVVQASKLKVVAEPKKPKFGVLLTQRCGSFDQVLIFTNTYDRDEKSIRSTSEGFY